jgi:dTDP-4-amino-4,6-dideoxygalactose transaminase
MDYSLKKLMISFSNPKLNNLKDKKQILSQIDKVIKSGQYILGSNVSSLEKKLSKYLNTKFVVSTNSGTDALVCALINIGVKKGDEVITTSHTATATSTAIQIVGGKPIYVDICEDDYCLNPKEIRKKITKKTKAIVVVHIYGHPAKLKEIQKIVKQNNLRLVEDCAQAIGSNYMNKKVGTFGDYGCYSFFPTKNLSAIGDAGAIICKKKSDYKKLLKIRQYGWNKKRISNSLGINSRCDELQAAILNVKIPKLSDYIKKRNLIAKKYDNLLKDLPVVLPKINSLVYHSFHLYVVRVKKSLRDKLINYMKKHKIYLGIHYKTPCHLMPNFKKNNTKLKFTEKICNEIVSLPIYPELKFNEIIKITSLIKNFYKNNK